MKIVFSVIVLCGLGNFSLPSRAFSLPPVKADEKLIWAVDMADLDDLIPFANFEARGSGQCYGINRLNNILLQHKIRFQRVDGNNPQADDDLVIEPKLLAAQKAKAEKNFVTIFGYSTQKEFMQRMNERKEDPDNPLKEAIEELEESQDPLVNAEEISNRNRLELAKGRQRARQDEAQEISESLEKKIPVSLSIGIPRGRHSVTAIAYLTSQEFESSHDVGSQKYKFFVLDPNHPQDLKELDLNVDSSGESYWYYPDWIELFHESGTVDLALEKTT